MTPGAIERVLAVQHTVGDLRSAVGRWEALGFAVDHHTIPLAGGAIELDERAGDDAGAGITGLVLGTDDVGAAALALSSAGIATSEARATPPAGVGGYAVFSRHVVVGAGGPEGRLEVAERAPIPTAPIHPNGARRLEAVELAVPVGELGLTADRYARLLDRWPAVAGMTATFDLGGTALVVTDEWAAPDRLGELRGRRPRIVALRIGGPDPADLAWRAVAAGLPVVRRPDGGVVLPGSAGFGVDIVVA